MPRTKQVAGGKKADGKLENTEECINREPFPASRSSFFEQLYTAFSLFCFDCFSLLVLARPATDYIAYIHYHSSSFATMVRWSKQADCQ